MRRTRLCILVLAAGWLCFLVALVARSAAPALLGLVLLAATLPQRPSTALVQVERRIPAQVEEGEAFEVALEARGPAADAPMFVEQDLPPGVALVEARAEPGRGSARLVLRATTAHPGVATWGNARVRVQDPWGLVEEEIVVPLRDHVRALPKRIGIAAGRRAGRPAEMLAKAQQRLEADWEPEIERLRDYQPGDRLRDIDWAQTTRLGKLISREISRQSQMPVVVLLEATSSVRWSRRVAKLDTLVQATLGVMSAAQSAGLPAGLVVYDDRGIVAQVRVSASRKMLASALAGLAALPAAEPVAEIRARPEPASLAAPSAEDRAFLEAVARFDPHAPRGLTPLEAALGAVASVSPQPSLVVCMLDAEETPALAAIVPQRLVRHGHRCILAAPASGVHHYALDEVDNAVLDSLVLWRTNREVAAATCRAARIPFVSLGTQVDANLIQGVIRSAR